MTPIHHLQQKGTGCYREPNDMPEMIFLTDMTPLKMKCVGISIVALMELD